MSKEQLKGQNGVAPSEKFETQQSSPFRTLPVLLVVLLSVALYSVSSTGTGGSADRGDVMVPQVVAHRGFSAVAPENTLSAISRAIESGVDMVEIDVQLSSDGTVVVMHDNSVDRTTNGSGKVKNMKWGEIEQLDAGSWFSDEFVNEKVPRLEDALQLFKECTKTRLLIELKFNFISWSGILQPIPGLAKRVAELVSQHDAQGCVVVQSFIHSYLVEIKEIDETIECSHLLFPWKSTSEQSNVALYSVNPNYWSLSHSQVETAHKLNRKVFVWTVDSKERVTTCLEHRVDGIITNDPLHVMDVIKMHFQSKL